MKAQKNTNGTVSVTGMTREDILRIFEVYEKEKREMQRCGWVPKGTHWLEDCIFEASKREEEEDV